MNAASVNQALLVSLSLAAVYGAAFFLHVDTPFWAAYTVILLTDLPTVGQTIHKCLLRIGGTAAGSISALMLYVLADGSGTFVFTGLAVYMFAALYLMYTFPQFRYLFYISAFVCMLVAVLAAAMPQDVFRLAFDRTEETLLGIIVHLVIVMLAAIPMGRITAAEERHPPFSERLRVPARAVILFCAVCAVWEFCPPMEETDTGFIIMGMLFVMSGLYMGLPRLSLLLRPYVMGMIVMFVPYVFIYPRLTGVVELLILIFVINFAIMLAYPERSQTYIRLAYLLPWLSVGRLGNAPDFHLMTYLSGCGVLLFALLAAITAEMVIFPSIEETPLTEPPTEDSHAS